MDVQSSKLLKPSLNPTASYLHISLFGDLDLGDPDLGDLDRGDPALPGEFDLPTFLLSALL